MSSALISVCACSCNKSWQRCNKAKEGVKQGVKIERELEEDFNLYQTTGASTDDDKELEENLLQDTELDNSNNRENLLQNVERINFNGRENLLQYAEIDNSNDSENLLQDIEEVDNSSREELPAFVMTRSGRVSRPPSDCKISLWENQRALWWLTDKG